LCRSDETYIDIKNAVQERDEKKCAQQIYQALDSMGNICKYNKPNFYSITKNPDD